jgi:DNA-binding CsgD family transcriptional regulator
MGAATVIGREPELDSIEGFVAAIAAGPAAMVLQGEPGIGKTLLWERGVELAERRSWRVMACRGAQAEAGLSFAGLTDFLAGAFDDAASALLPVRREALEVALLLRQPGSTPSDPLAVGLAFLDVLRVLAEERPVMVAIDDVQWLDPPTAGVLQLAVRRLTNERVGLLATLREANDAAVPLELERLLREGHPRRVRLGPLDPRALHHLLRARLHVELARSELKQLHHATGGNPFFALELARTPSPPAGATWLRVPDSLGTVLGNRLERLAPEVREVLLTVAAAARPTAELVASAQSNREHALAALEPALREGVVVLDGPRIRFAHPLLASVCYADAPTWRRQAVHRALADAVEDVEERARHLALASERPDAEIASELDAAAEHAGARGATGSAADLAELAVSLTPPDDVEQRRRRHTAAAWWHRFAGDFERATATWEQLLGDVPAGTERADLVYAIATTGNVDIPTRIRLCEGALAEIARHGDDARAVQILGFLAISRWVGGDVPAALVDARDGLERAERLGDRALLATALSRLGLIESNASEITPGLLERGVAIERTLDRPLLFHDSPKLMLAVQLIQQGELDRARSLLESLIADAVATGDEHKRAFGALQLVYLEWYAGRWELALEHAAAAGELAEQTHERQFAGMLAAQTARVEADLGLVDRARETANAGHAASESVSDRVFSLYNRAALGYVDLVVGDYASAADRFRDVPAQLVEIGQRGLGPTDFWPDAIEALITIGDRALAHEYLTRYEVLPATSMRADAAGRRCRGALAAADGDVQSSVEAFEDALGRLEGLPFPLERGRSLLGLGAARRQGRQKRLARADLEQALAIFEELDAPFWAHKARAELRRISGRRAAASELTETEQRVATLAVRGRQNKEIAAELFVSVRTVEAHLSRIYGKLSVRSRAELATSLASKITGDGAKVQ